MHPLWHTRHSECSKTFQVLASHSKYGGSDSLRILNDSLGGFLRILLGLLFMFRGNSKSFADLPIIELLTLGNLFNNILFIEGSGGHDGKPISGKRSCILIFSEWIVISGLWLPSTKVVEDLIEVLSPLVWGNPLLISLLVFTYSNFFFYKE